MLKRVGKRTVEFENPPMILSYGSSAGQKEKEGPLGKCIDFVTEDDKLGEKSWEYAETAFQKKAISSAINRGGLTLKDMTYVCGGDLLNQCTATAYCVRDLDLPFIGLYNACATMAEGISTGAMLLDGGYAEKVLTVASSHFCDAERQFRYPLEYGGQRPPSAQWTVTGSGAVILGENNNKLSSKIRVKRAVTGKVIDLGIKDANNMGAAMAPAFFDTVFNFFKDTNQTPDAYDLIISGDLAYYGRKIAIDLFRKEGIELEKNFVDCGLMIFDREKQDVHAGGSGCGCSGVVLTSKIIPEMLEKKLKRVLFIGTGALMSPVMLLQKESIPSIAHLVELEID